MTARPVLTERRVRISDSETIVARLEQAKQGALVVRLFLEVQRGTFHNATPALEILPRDARRVAEAIAGEREH